MTQFYAYLHCRPDFSPFYVGKGQGSRCYKMVRNHNPHHQNIVKKYGKENILVGKLDCSSEEIAFELEIGLIKCLRRSGVKLTNQTDGGEGASGHVQSEEACHKVTLALTGRAVSEETKKKISKSISEVWKRDGHRERVSSKQKGRVVTPEQRLQISKAVSLTLSSQGFKEKHKLSMASPEVRAKISEARKGNPGRPAPHTEEAKRKISEKAKAQWVRYRATKLLKALENDTNLTEK